MHKLKRQQGVGIQREVQRKHRVGQLKTYPALFIPGRVRRKEINGDDGGGGSDCEGDVVKNRRQ